jgi:tetratricopeptide (TPR) repeat protein
MAANISFVKTQYAYISIIPRLLVFAVLCLLFYPLDKHIFFILAIVVYYCLYIELNILIPTDHRKGIQLIKKGKFEEAIPCFQKSADYFTKYAWIDKYRYLTLLLSSKRTMWEISMCNEAWCLLQIKKIDEAKRIYEKVLDKYPKNAVANTSIMTINSIMDYKDQ